MKKALSSSEYFQLLRRCWVMLIFASSNEEEGKVEFKFLHAPLDNQALTAGVEKRERDVFGLSVDRIGKLLSWSSGVKL